MARVPLGGDPRLRRNVVFEAGRALRRETAEQGQALRDIRLRLGLTQADVARAVGSARSVVSRVEAGDPSVSLAIRCRIAVLLGARMRLPIYADGTALLHDAVHARIVERLVGRAHPLWNPTLEASVPGPGRRSTDVRLDDGRDVVLAEVETHLGRWEEALREMHGKRAAVIETDLAGGRIHVVLVLPPTRHHRDLVASIPESVRRAFPVPSSELEAALQGGGPWPGDGILWIPGGVSREGQHRDSPTRAAG